MYVQSFIHNIQKVEKPQIPINCQVDELEVVYAYKDPIVRHKKPCSPYICNCMGEPLKHYVGIKEPRAKRPQFHVSSYLESSERQICKDSRLALKNMEGQMNQWLHRYESSLRSDKSTPELVVMGARHDCKHCQFVYFLKLGFKLNKKWRKKTSG